MIKIEFNEEEIEVLKKTLRPYIGIDVGKMISKSPDRVMSKIFDKIQTAESKELRSPCIPLVLSRPQCGIIGAAIEAYINDPYINVAHFTPLSAYLLRDTLYRIRDFGAKKSETFTPSEYKIIKTALRLAVIKKEVKNLENGRIDMGYLDLVELEKYVAEQASEVTND